MIVFDLSCSVGHVFEAWFGSRDDYDDQRARGLLACPMCGDAEVGKAPMAPRIASSGAASVPAKEPAAVLRALMKAQAEALARSEDVGGRFASEVRAIHDGDAEQRPIHGQATLAEAKSLLADGLPVAPLPFPVRDRARDN